MFDLIDILLPAFVAGLLVLSTHVPLGFQVLKRGIIFIDLAIAQIAGLGAIVVEVNGINEHLFAINYLVAVVFALAGAGIIALFERYAKAQLEALIGCLYVLSATAAFLLLAHDPHGGDLLKQVLSGQILWVTFEDIYVHAIIYAALLILMLTKPKLLSGKGFYFVFAVAITSSVQLVGVFLVFSTLIMPTLICSSLTGNKKYGYAYGMGLTSYLLGLILSASYDLPSGASIVWCLATLAAITAFFIKATGKVKT